jgi:release factor glutamine methyltransferase
MQAVGTRIQDAGKSRHLLHNGIVRLTACGIEEARLDAELLLAAAQDITRSRLLAHLDETPTAIAAKRFQTLLDRRARHEPIAYILGHKEFFGLDLLVDRRVLIPRPETEMLVEQALGWIKANLPFPAGERRGRLASSNRGEGGLRILDLGTGSGAIILALASQLDLRHALLAADRSVDALAIARANAERFGLSSRITFVQSDLFDTINVPIDLIVANLPYVSQSEWRDLSSDIVDYEPHEALDGGPDGLDTFRRLFMQAPQCLAPGGALMLEIGSAQGASTMALARSAFPRADVTVVKDLAGLDRMVTVAT